MTGFSAASLLLASTSLPPLSPPHLSVGGLLRGANEIFKLFGMPLLLVVICELLLRSAYLEVKNESIKQLNKHQLLIAKYSATD